MRRSTLWAVIFGLPYAVFLGLLVALFDLIPTVGSTIGGIIVALVALSVSLPLAIATAVFYLVNRFREDYLLTPRVMAHTVAVPGLVTVLAATSATPPWAMCPPLSRRGRSALTAAGKPSTSHESWA